MHRYICINQPHSTLYAKIPDDITFDVGRHALIRDDPIWNSSKVYEIKVLEELEFAHDCFTLANGIRIYSVLHNKHSPQEDSTTALLKERGSKYGPFTGHAEVTQSLKHILLGHIYTNNKKLAADQREAIDMICHKLGRIANGDPNYADSWIDIAGYATLVANRLKSGEEL